jgi:serine/threonine protein kinase
VGLVQLHSRNIIHHDLKPANILLAKEERLRAKIAGALSAQLQLFFFFFGPHVVLPINHPLTMIIK